MKFLLSLLFILGSIAVAFAGGTSPGLYYGQVPTASQWNSYFASKLDFTPGAINTMTYWDGNGNLLNALVRGDCTSAANVFTCHASGGASGPVAATTLSASSTVSGAGFSAYLASPPAIGSTTPNTIAATTVKAPLIYTSALTAPGSISSSAYYGFLITGLTGSAWDYAILNPAQSAVYFGVPTGQTYVNFGTGLNSPAIGAQAPGTIVGTTITANTQFSGPGTGLTGTASGLSIGGNAATATAATSATNATNTTNVSGGTQWGVLYQSAVGTTASTTAGAAGYALTSNGSAAPTWQPITATLGLASPSPIGSTTPNTIAATTLSATSTVSGTGFSSYMASPPAIGGTSPNTIKSTTENVITSFSLNNNLMLSSATPTIKSCGSGASISLATNSNAMVVVSGTGSPSICSVNMPPPTTRWVCLVQPSSGVANTQFSCNGNGAEIDISSYLVTTGAASTIPSGTYLLVLVLGQ